MKVLSSTIKRENTYFKRTLQLTHERVGRSLAGLSILLFTFIAYFFDIGFLAVTTLIALNLIQSGITNKCLVKSMLIKLGFPGEKELIDEAKV